MKGDRHGEYIPERDLPNDICSGSALLACEMREDAGLTQGEIAKKVGTPQPVIARLEEAEYTRHSLTIVERIAAACGVG